MIIAITLLLLTAPGSANPLDYQRNYKKCTRIVGELFKVQNSGIDFLNNCQLSLSKTCNTNECYDKATFQCLENLWIAKLKAIKNFNKAKCYQYRKPI